jgi:hypothetical protein
MLVTTHSTAVLADRVVFRLPDPSNLLTGVRLWSEVPVDGGPFERVEDGWQLEIPHPTAHRIEYLYRVGAGHDQAQLRGHVRLDARVRVRCRVHRGAQLVQPARHVALAQRRDQVVAGAEVAVDRIARQGGPLSEPPERERRVPLVEQDLLRGVEQRFALLRAVLGDGGRIDLRHPPEC